MSDVPCFYSIGFFGTPNIGDELLCQAVADAIQQAWPGSRHLVLTADRTVSRRYIDTESVYVQGFAPQPEYLASFIDHWRAVRASDLVLVGGGGLVADGYSWASLLRYAIDAALATATGRRFVLVGVGAVPIRRPWLVPVARFLCREAAACFCRDAESAALVADYGRRDDVVVAPDLGHLLGARLEPAPGDGLYALVNVREFPPIDAAAVASLCEALVERVGDVRMLPAEPGESRYLERILGSVSPAARSRMRIVEPGSLAEAIDAVRHARVVVAERLHVNLIAAHLERRIVTITYEGKVDRLMRGLGAGHLAVDIGSVGPDLAERALELSPPDRAEVLRGRAETARSAFRRTVEAGLDAPRPGWRARSRGLLLFVAILGVTLVRAPLLALKRAIFGRGPIRAGAA